MIKSREFCVCLAAVALPALATAQDKLHPDPAHAGAHVPPVVYVSPLQRYQPLGDDAVSSWKGANETVGNIGGWRAYAREAQQATPGAAQPSSSKPAAPIGHPGHAGH